MTMKLAGLFIICAALVAATQAQTEAWRPSYLGVIPLANAAFAELIPTENQLVDPLDKYTLYISAFNPATLFQTDHIYYMRSPARQLYNVSAWELTLVDRDNYWPNEIIPMPSSIMGTEGIIWTSGFLTPTKTKGQLNMYLTTTDPLDGPYNIASLDSEEWSYHTVEWYDVNNDGSLDAVTARFRIIGGENITQLLWMENPGLNIPSEGWAQYIVHEGGPDVNFKMESFYVGIQPFLVIIAAEFWSEKLTILYAEDGSGSFLLDNSTLRIRTVDTTVGRAFDIAYEDLNLDGRPEILLTGFNYTEGFAYAYAVPNDFRIDAFEKHIIASGFIPNDITTGTMSPGNIQSYFKDQAHATSGLKPYVMISGDDDGKQYILTPDSEDPANFTYTKHLFIETNDKIAGDFAIADIDDDGYLDVLSLAYSAGQIYVHTYKPPI